MTTISEKHLVHAPLASAKRFLNAFFDAHRGAATAEAVVTLKAGELGRAAIVTLAVSHHHAEMTPHFTVAWKDAHGGPYPAFAGTLAVESDEDYGAFWLVIDGAYAPPGGIGGQLFDAAIGRRIAESTARGLLTEIAVATEQRFHAEETAKAHVT